MDHKSAEISSLKYQVEFLNSKVQELESKMEDMLKILGATAYRLNGFIDAADIVSEEKIEKHTKKMLLKQ